MTMNNKEAIQNLLAFYGILDRPLTTLEIYKLIQVETNLTSVVEELETLTRAGTVTESCGFFSLAKRPLGNEGRRKQDFLLDLKWKKLSCYARWFRHIPFVEFALASGSMALGNVTTFSDFDILTGVRKGRMFTSRYCTLALFFLLGARRSNDKKESGLNKLCFNHFVIESTFAKPPYNMYRRELYRNLVPLWGKPEKLEMFFSENKQLSGLSDVPETRRYIRSKTSAVCRAAEFALSGRFGDWLEKQSARIAKRRLARYIKNRPQTGRVVISDSELEFHFSLPYEAEFEN